MSRLRVWYVDVGARQFDIRRSLPVILAETEDEAYGVSLERLDAATLSYETGMVEDEGGRFLARGVFPWPKDVTIVAFDYFNPRRLIVAQSADAWAAHYGQPLLMRAYAKVACGYSRTCLWYWAQEHSQHSVALNEIHDRRLPEAERRKLVAKWVRCRRITAREVEAAARVHADTYLPMYMRGRVR